MSDRQRQQRIEKSIIALAELNTTMISEETEERRNKRSIGRQDDGGATKFSRQNPDLDQLRVLEPFAFQNSVGPGVALVPR